MTTHLFQRIFHCWKHFWNFFFWRYKAVSSSSSNLIYQMIFFFGLRNKKLNAKWVLKKICTVPGLTLNWWWGSNTAVLGNVEYFIIINLRVILSHSSITCKGPIYGLNRIIQSFTRDYQYYIELLMLNSNTWNHLTVQISKVSDLGRGWPGGSLFNSYYSEV